MHSYQSYLQGLSSQELKGGLWGWCQGLASYVEDAVILMVDILRSRGDLDPETAEAVEKRLQRERAAKDADSSGKTPEMEKFLS